MNSILGVVVECPAGDECEVEKKKRMEELLDKKKKKEKKKVLQNE